MPVDVSMRCSRCERVLAQTTLADRLCNPTTLPFVVAEAIEAEAPSTPCGACDGQTRPDADRAFRRALRARLARARPGRGFC